MKPGTTGANPAISPWRIRHVNRAMYHLRSAQIALKAAGARELAQKAEDLVTEGRKAYGIAGGLSAHEREVTQRALSGEFPRGWRKR